jgi:hypothetical protein|tara:strand:+ start:112 stop:240 length:129 start_codon:yes stop_codon:yes gene_type:complete
LLQTERQQNELRKTVQQFIFGENENENEATENNSNKNKTAFK